VSGRQGRTTLIYFLTQVGTTLSGFAATWYINVRLGAGAFGEYSTAVGFLFWLNIPASALGGAVNKRMSEGEAPRAFLAAGHLANLAVNAVIVGGLLLFRGQVNVFIGLDVAVFFAALVGARAVFDVAVSALRGNKQVGLSGAIKTFESVVRSGVHIGALFLLGIGVGGLVIGHAAALLLATVAGVALLDERPAKPSREHFASLGRYAQYSWVGTLKTRAFAWTDIVMMRGLSLSVLGLATVTKAQLGIYNVSWTLASVLALVSIAIKQTLFPELSRLGVDDEYERIHHFLNEGLAFTGIFAIPGLFGAAVVGDKLLTVFGAEYAAGGGILVVLIGARLFAAYTEQFINVINGIDRPDVAFRVNGVYIAMTLVSNFVLISLFGWWGAAFATALSALVSILVAGFAASRLIGRPDVPLRDIGAQLAASLLMFGAVFGSNRVVPDTLAWTFVVVGLGAFVYVIALLTISTRVRRKTIGALPVDLSR
jgi:O-antigen/teichoic acid export membrane protein